MTWNERERSRPATAVSVGSSIGLQPPKAFGVDRRLPEVTQRVTSAQRLERLACHEDRRTSGTMVNLGWFPGAACCKPIDLPHGQAAPLQAYRDVQSHLLKFVSIRGHSRFICVHSRAFVVRFRLTGRTLIVGIPYARLLPGPLSE